MTWQRRKWITAALGVATAFCDLWDRVPDRARIDGAAQTARWHLTGVGRASPVQPRRRGVCLVQSVLGRGSSAFVATPTPLIVLA